MNLLQNLVRENFRGRDQGSVIKDSHCFQCKTNSEVLRSQGREVLKTCSRCGCAQYCSQKCQVEHFGAHKKMCSYVRSCMKTSQNCLAKNDLAGASHARILSVAAMQHMAIDERSYSSLEKALDEAMVIMRGFPQILSFQLYYWMPLDMLLLGHYYDAYNLLKHWLKVCQAFSNGFPVEPTSEDPAENIFESLEIDIKKHPKPAADNFQILALALLKFKTIQALNDKFNFVMKGSSLANVQHVNVAVVNVKRKIHHFLTKNQEKHFNFYLDAIEDPYPGFLETLLLRK